jgi:hypothetical protein
MDAEDVLAAQSPVAETTDHDMDLDLFDVKQGA